jgi:hypothetical protein
LLTDIPVGDLDPGEKVSLVIGIREEITWF